MATDSRIDRLEEDVRQIGQSVAGIEGQLRQIGERLSDMNTRLTSLEGRITTMWITTMGTIAAGVIFLVVERVIRN